MITRRIMLAATLATLAVPSLPAAEVTTRTLRMTWTCSTRTQVDYMTVPATPEPEVGVMEFGQGVSCLIEVV